MKLYIDASRYGAQEPTGVEVYSQELLPRLHTLARGEGIETVFLHRPGGRVPEQATGEIIPGRRFWTLLHMSWYFLLRRNHALFVPSHILPLIAPKITVVTIHDVAWRYFPEAYSRGERALLEYSTRFAVRFARRIIAVSDVTRRDLIERFGCAPEKITTIPMGFDAHRFQEEARHFSEEQLRSLGLAKGRYVVYVGRLESKKNVKRLVQAFLSADLASDVRLVLVGKPGAGAEDFQELLKHPRVLVTGYVENTVRSGLIRYAGLFAFVSLYEGFGFPVLEALSLGVPVLASQVGALPEVGGSFVHFVDPCDEEAIRKGLEQGIRVRHVPDQDRLAQHMAQFHWDVCARKTWNVLLQTMKR